MDKINKHVIRLAYEEDVRNGDITSLATIKRTESGKAYIVAKSEGVLSGVEPFTYAMGLSSKKIKIDFKVMDGGKYKPGKKLVTIEGPSQAMLRGERLALNLISHLSGVATLTARFVAKVKGTKTKVLDTRKTTPGLRVMEKAAVLHGGGANHRMGLYDMVLIKDNHIAAVGGVDKALERVAGLKCKIEIEVSDLAELEIAAHYSPDIIMLDNFTTANMKKAVSYIRSLRKGIKLEVSGGVNLSNISSYAKTGVDFISIGALTHSAPAADFSMKYIQ